LLTIHLWPVQVLEILKGCLGNEKLYYTALDSPSFKYCSYKKDL